VTPAENGKKSQLKKVDTVCKIAAGDVGTCGNLPQMSMTPAANLPPVSLTPVANFSLVLLIPVVHLDF
jgi:hypothetical protein